MLGDDGDFDLADALDEPGLYPKLPVDPLPSDPHGGGIYPPPRPRPQPQPHPQPRPQPSDTNGFGGSGGYGGHGGHENTHGGHAPVNDGAQGNTVARIVSPIVSVVVVALVGAGVSYFRSGQRRGCLRRSDPETI
ncbi:hypothetical protein U0070_024794 [Myodes glareolus]|uniref:Glycoprotein Xg n=1 Tax=Myodes glareolus TaxID=447135 RepID=A0AAW0H1C3_MYOGA